MDLLLVHHCALLVAICIEIRGDALSSSSSVARHRLLGRISRQEQRNDSNWEHIKRNRSR